MMRTNMTNNRLIVILHKKNSQNDAYKHDLSFTPLLFSYGIMKSKNLKYFSTPVNIIRFNE
jgi:hypothetical protein